MSFIAGYLMGLEEGGGSSSDSRVQKLKNAPVKWGFNIGRYTILVKITDIVDQIEMLKLYDSEEQIKDHIIYNSIYYCVYFQDEFLYAVSIPRFEKKYHLSNLGADTKILDTITENYDFFIRNGTMSLKKSDDFLNIKVEGVYTHRISSYLGYDHILSGTSTSLYEFTNSCNAFNGSLENNYNYIVADGVDFYDAVIGLFNTCKANAD